MKPVVHSELLTSRIALNFNPMIAESELLPSKPKLLSIVICDDHAISQLGIQCALQDFLPHRKLHFWKTSSGKEAIRLVKEHSPDLLTLDLRLPDMSGLEILKTIREQGISTKVLVLTNEEYLPTLVQLVRYKVNGILLKSYTLPMLEAALLHLEKNTSDRPYLDPSLKNQFEDELKKRQLSSREFEVLQLLLQGHTNKSIAEILTCSPETIKTLRARIMEKTQTHNRSEISNWFHRRIVNWT